MVLALIYVATVRLGWSAFDSWIGIVVFAAMSIMATYAVFAYFERPIRRWILNRHAIGE